MLKFIKYLCCHTPSYPHYYQMLFIFILITFKLVLHNGLKQYLLFNKKDSLLYQQTAFFVMTRPGFEPVLPF